MKKSKMEQWQLEDAQRLRALWDAHQDRTGTSQAAFGADARIGTQGMVHQYITGLTPLNLAAAGKFAKAFGVEIDEISPTLADQVRELYLLCDSQKNIDFNVSPQARDFIRQEIRREMEKAKIS